jgi:hypothetical protein
MSKTAINTSIKLEPRWLRGAEVGCAQAVVAVLAGTADAADAAGTADTAARGDTGAVSVFSAIKSKPKINPKNQKMNFLNLGVQGGV